MSWLHFVCASCNLPLGKSSGSSIVFTAGHVGRTTSLKSHFVLLLCYLWLFSKTIIMKSNKDSFITDEVFCFVEIPEQVSEFQLL